MVFNGKHVNRYLTPVPCHGYDHQAAAEVTLKISKWYSKCAALISFLAYDFIMHK
jgi:hypothetical protein